MPMWTFEQSTGSLYDPTNNLVEKGYSGNGVWKDDPASQSVKDHGPLPAGLYSIGAAIADGGHLGPFVMPLTPDPRNDMCDRGGFFIHGDNITAPGTASDGCIIMSHTTRVAINASEDKQLTVVATFNQLEDVPSADQTVSGA
jgi:hypothetical protein